jgi:glycosyltransferase involved in cell wall biosynthesis
MLAAMRRAGIRVGTVVLRDRRAALGLRALDARVVVVDTIAANLAAPELGGLRARGSRVIALAHMWHGALLLARRADGVIAVSGSLAEELVAAGVERRRVVVVRPGRDPLTRRASARRSGSVLCVANWIPTKGIHTLIAAVARVPEVTLELVGDAPDPVYASRLRDLIGARGVASRVRAYGSLSRAALERRYAAASIFALPSVREGYPIVVVEALAHGLPVIGCDIAGVREVTDGAAILVPPGRIGPLAAALRSLASDDRSREHLARRARRRARTLATWTESGRDFVRAVRAR